MAMVAVAKRSRRRTKAARNRKGHSDGVWSQIIGKITYAPCGGKLRLFKHFLHPGPHGVTKYVRIPFTTASQPTSAAPHTPNEQRPVDHEQRNSVSDLSISSYSWRAKEGWPTAVVRCQDSHRAAAGASRCPTTTASHMHCCHSKAAL